MTRQLALELGPKVRVNALAPGLVKTHMARALWETDEEGIAARHPMRRIGAPDDVAGAALYLASDLAAWLTGAVLVIDGGLSLV
jgi:NAD(P)-dependent dehydrogenase (short-subunit alcohol dehydrogenase family)